MSVNMQKQPVETIRPDPTVLFIERIVTGIPRSLFPAAFIGFIVGMIRSDFVTGGLAAVGISVVLSAWYVYAGKLAVDNTEYRVYDDEIEAESGVLSTQIQNVRFDEITNVTRRQSFIEKRFGLGRVKVSTAGTSGKTLKMKDIPEHEKWYEFFREKQHEN